MMNLLLANFAAPFLMLDLPSVKKLVVNNIEEYPRETTDEYYNHCIYTDEMEMPHRLVIDGSDDTVKQFTIGINLEQNIIEYADWSLLTSKKSANSGELGILLFGLPGLIITSPLWATQYAAFGALKAISGYDQHMLSLYLRIKDQLPEYWQETWRQACLNHCNGVAEAYFQSLRDQEIEELMKDPDRELYGL